MYSSCSGAANSAASAGVQRFVGASDLTMGRKFTAGDFVYFSPYVPHQERNLSADEAVEILVVRSDNEKIVVALNFTPLAHPEMVS
jgi:uncharacterized RmlC-like cupin family protein